MKYYICTELKMICPNCDQIYNIQIKDKKDIDSVKIKCKCGYIFKNGNY